MGRTTRLLRLLAATLILAGTISVPAQSSPPVMEASLTGAGRYAFSRLSALAVSPTSDRFAVADENLNRVFVFQSSGQLAFVIGETGFLNGPCALNFENDASLLVVTKEKLVLRVNESTPEQCDTLADLAATLKPSQIRKISHLVLDKSGYLLLDPELGQVVLLDSTWGYTKVIVAHGHGARGKVWEPSDLERDLSGRLIISDRGDYPLQVFSTSGSLLFTADWNMPDRQRTWEAAAVAITRQEMIWVVDASNRKWRVYDQTGTAVDEYDLTPPGIVPLAASVTVDNKLILVDERGTVSIWSIL
ncbi:MAG: hypothetical protein IPH75_05105 [bacterium]|nr:hypothetical protein [bacterium]